LSTEQLQTESLNNCLIQC